MRACFLSVARTSGRFRAVEASLALAVAVASSTAWAAQHTGNVAMLEVWPSGNVAFTLATAVPTCNQQFILNASSPGTKSLYAALLAAKIAGKPIRVDTVACGPAEGYGGSYNLVNYLYVQD